jgi:pimeloyl-ACP methyl ester carboxylesterase
VPRASSGKFEIEFEDAGEGREAIVFVPGLGLPRAAFSLVTPSFTPRYRVITIDPRGAGASAKPDMPYTAETVVADVEAVLDAAGLKQAHFVGLSMGGMIGQELALRRPARVASLILLSTYAAVDEWSGRCMRLRRKLIDRLGLIDQFELSLLLVSCPSTVGRAPELVALFEGMLRADPPPVESYCRQLDFCLEHDARDRLTGLETPTLVITGSDDILTPPHQGRELARLIPGALYREVSEASHALLWERPNMLAELIESFIAWVSAGQPTDREAGLLVESHAHFEFEGLKLPGNGP